MKNLKVLLFFTLSIFLLNGCSSGVTQQEYENIKSELATTKETYETLSTNYAVALDKIKEYEKIIEPYKELTEIELLAQKAAADVKVKEEQLALEKLKQEEEAKVAEEKAVREAKEKADKEAKEAEEKLGYDTGITFSQLARTPDDYMLKKIKFKGKVVQVMEGDKNNTLRFAVNSDYDKIMILEYDKSIVSFRILEDDIITIYGVSYGLYSYESTMGKTITIPSAIVDKIDQ